MTTPITPNPAIHNDSINVQALEQAALQELTTLTQIFETFANQIILMVLNAVLRAFGLGAFAGPIDGVVSELEGLLEAIPSGNIQAILGSLNLGADVQAIVDSVANALGISGVDHTLATLISALEAIPSGNVAAILGSLNLGADVQAIVDKLANAWGFSGTGHTLANLLSYAQAIPGSVISGITTIEQNLIDNINNALGVTGTGHTVASVLTALENIPGSAVSSITAIEQNTLDAIANALGFAGTGHSVAQIESFLANFPASVVFGGLTNATLPGGNITGAISAALVSGTTTIEQNILDGIANALGHAGTGHTVAQIQSYLGAIPGSNIASAISASLINGATVWDQQLWSWLVSFVNGLNVAFNGIAAFDNAIQNEINNDVNALINYTNYIEGAIIGWVQGWVPSVIRDFF